MFMNKLSLFSVIIAGTLISTTAFAGQGYDVTICNTTANPIKYESISQWSWHHDDIPWGWVTLPAESSTNVLYTENQATFTDYGFNSGYICVGIENTGGGKIGTFGIKQGYNIDYPDAWYGMHLTDQTFHVRKVSGYAPEDYNLEFGQYKNQPTISGNASDSSNPYVVNIYVGKI